MKKSLLLLLASFMLVGCSTGDSVKEDKGDEPQQENNHVRNVNISKEDLIQHVNVSSLTFECYSGYASNYLDHVYTTNIKGSFNLLRNGYVTYTGSASYSFQIGQSYLNKNNEQVTKHYLIEGSIEFSPFVTSQDITKTYSLTRYYNEEYTDIVQDHIPFSSYPSSSSINKDSQIFLERVIFTKSNIVATYYDYGVGGDVNNLYKSIEINNGNWSAYFKISSTGISPLSAGKYFDYRVTVTIGTTTYTLKRNGYVTFDEEINLSSVKQFSGYIDVYPDRTI